MPFISFSRLLIIAALLCTCLVPLTGALAYDLKDCESWNSNPQLSIRSCTALINAGNETPLDLAYMHQLRGIAYNKTGQHDAAMTDFNRAIALDPEFAEAYQSRAARFEAQGLKDLAIRDFRKALQLKPGLDYAQEALRRLGAASTPAPSTAPVRRAPPPVRQAPRVNLALELQRELKRIGCYTGGLDGDWGRGSQSALRRFSNQAGLRLGTQPSQKALAEAKETARGYCQPVRVAPRRAAPKRKKRQGCRAGTVLLDGQCIPRSQVASFCGPGFERRGTKCVRMQDGASGRCKLADYTTCNQKAREYCEGNDTNSCLDRESRQCLREEIGCNP